jgi:CDP-glycerol glycerophosphotransferase (TagB/SpsB family)
MLYNYGSIFPGKLNLTFESFLSELQKAMNGGPSKKQMQVKRLFHMYIDGKNSQRICERLIDEL